MQDRDEALARMTNNGQRLVRWQYRSEWNEGDVESLGLEGWEAYAVTAHPSADRDGFVDSPCQWHLRRPLPDEAQ